MTHHPGDWHDTVKYAQEIIRIRRAWGFFAGAMIALIVCIILFSLSLGVVVVGIWSLWP